MAHPDTPPPSGEIAAAAAACAAALADSAPAAGSADLDAALGPLLHAIRHSHQRFAFDSEGRPGAIEAVRQALPAVECDLFDAVIEDHACEVAALREALCCVARTARLGRTGS